MKINSAVVIHNFSGDFVEQLNNQLKVDYLLAEDIDKIDAHNNFFLPFKRSKKP
jgi:hypothetical protein